MSSCEGCGRRRTSEDLIMYRGKGITRLFPSGYYEVYSDEQGRFLKFDEIGAAKALIDAHHATHGDGA